MSTIVINVPQETYRRLQEEARKAGKAPEVLTRELLEISLQAREESRQRTARGILQASGRARPLGERLRNKIIPGVTLDEVRESLTKAGGPLLSEIILTQRGANL